MFGQGCQEWSYQVIPNECDSSFRLISKDCYSGYFNWHELWSHHQLPGQHVFGNCSRPSTVCKLLLPFPTSPGKSGPLKAARQLGKRRYPSIREAAHIRKSYCCRNHRRGCIPQNTPAPFDCDAGNLFGLFAQSLDRLFFILTTLWRWTEMEPFTCFITRCPKFINIHSIAKYPNCI